MPAQKFRDRRDAGRKLAQKLLAYAHRPDVLVLALPRGGVPVAYEVALALGAPLDVCSVRKLGVPGHEELAMGAIAGDSIHLLNCDVIDALNISRAAILHAIARERAELGRREQLYRDGRPRPEIAGKTVLLIDDGLATGASMRAATAALREFVPSRIVVAVPVAPPESCAALRGAADDVVACETPEILEGVGSWYDDFAQVGDDEVRGLLRDAAVRKGAS
jgi:putative phosphoribosyl transferase